jgi:DNA-binding transcriptional ArsR family regulator
METRDDRENRDVGGSLSNVDPRCLDVGQITFASASFPLLESLASLRSLCLDHDARRRSRWQVWVAAHLPHIARPLLELVSVCGEAMLFAAVPEENLDRALAVVQATPAAVVRKRLADVSGERGVPGWVSAFVGADDGARYQLCDALRGYFVSCVLPYWRHVEASRARESARFSQYVLDAGIRSAVAKLLPDDSRHRAAAARRRPDSGFRGETLMLMPSPFWSGDPWLGTLSDGRAALVYCPAGSVAMLHEELPNRLDALQQLLGHTRAEVLCSLARPCGTTELASRIHMSLATTSEHATVLRAAGLILTTRRGRSVQHMLTDLGRQLVYGA